MWSVVGNLNASYLAQPESVIEARGMLTGFAVAAGGRPDQVEAVRLACSEALTNVVMHAYPGAGGDIHVTAAVTQDELWILIADDGCGLEPRANRPGLGFGLGLIAQLSDDVTIAVRANGGTEVRMRFDLDAARVLGAPAVRPPSTGSSRGHSRESQASAHSGHDCPPHGRLGAPEGC